MTVTAFDIGSITIRGGILAPMAGYTDIAFRELCRSFGAGLTVTEMVSVRGLTHDSDKTESLMRLSPLEAPSCIQLFGSDPDDFSRAAPRVPSDIIDVNMGCPMPKIVKNGDGSALLNKPELAGRIVRALKNSTDKLITVKTRLGYLTGDDRAAELIARVAENGAAAVTVHGRYAEQRYTGESDREKVEALARISPVPVIYNGDEGDCTSDPTPFAAVMIGRAALKNPALFCCGRADPVAVSSAHLALLTRYFDERYTVNAMRKFAVHYFSGVAGGREVRAAINCATCVADIERALDLAAKRGMK